MSRHLLLATVCLILALPCLAQQQAPEVTDDTALLLHFDGAEWADAAEPASAIESPDNPNTQDTRGRFGDCFSCDGRDDQVLIAADQNVRDAFSGSFTIETWVNLRDLPWDRQYYPAILAGRTADGDLSFFLDVNKYGNIVRLVTYGAPGEEQMTEIGTPRGEGWPLKAQVWSHVAVTYDGSWLRLFIDGALATSRRMSGEIQPVDELSVGARFGKAHLSGWIDELRISQGLVYTEDTAAVAAERNRAADRQATREEFEQYRLPEDPRWEKLHPRLVFDDEGLQELRNKLQQDQYRHYFDALIDECEGYIDPGHRMYLDPDGKYDFAFGISKPGMYATELALAYALTGRDEFADHSLAVVLNWTGRLGYEQARYDHEWVSSGWMLEAVALCYDWLYDYMSDEQRARLRMGIAELCQAIYEQTDQEQWVNLSMRNWQAMAAGGMGLGGLAIQGETLLPEHRFVRRAERFLSYYYNHAIGRGGAPIEGVHYFYYGQHQALIFAEALKLSGGRDLFHTTNLQYVEEYIPWVTMPWGEYFNNLKFGDRGKSSFYHVPLLLRTEFGGLSEWLWQAVWDDTIELPGQMIGFIWLPEEREAVMPAETLALARHFPDRGLVGMRTDWDEDAVVATMDAGRYEMAAHDQADRGNVTLIGYGNHWLTDSGRNSVDTEAHNLVLIDGEGQCREKPNSRTDGFITHFLDTEEMAIARADIKPAYDFWYDWDYMRQGPVNPVEQATRTVIFARGDRPMLLIDDHVTKDDAEHEYTLNLHSHATNDVQLDDNRISLTAATDDAPYLYQPAENGELGPIASTHSEVGSAEFDFTVEEAGDYVVWGYGRAGPRVPGASDSFYFELGGESGVYSVNGEPWPKWTQVPLSPMNLEAGQHTLTVRTREPEARLTYIYITANTENRPHLDLAQTGPQSVFLRASEPDRINEPMTVGGTTWEPIQEARCTIDILRPSDPALAVGMYEAHMGLHPRVSVTQQTTAARFLTLARPRPNGSETAVLQPVAAEGGSAWAVVDGGERDLIVCADGDAVSVEGLTTDANVALVRFEDGAPSWVAAAGVTHLTIGGQTLVESAQREYVAGPVSDLQTAPIERTAALEAPSPR